MLVKLLQEVLVQKRLIYYGRKRNGCPCTATAVINEILQLISILFFHKIPKGNNPLSGLTACKILL